MAEVTYEQIRKILRGTEVSGDINKAYVISLAVNNNMLGVKRGDNGSGFSFGEVQLDIGNNDYAQDAYAEILQNALNKGHITKDRYNDVQRPDMHDGFRDRYKEDMNFLDENVFNGNEETNATIERYTKII